MCKALVQRGCNPNHLDSHKKTPVEYAKKARFQQVADYLSMEAKKSQEQSKMANQNIGDESVNENTKRKKKDALSLNNNKNTYKITFMNENGEIRDLTED